MKIKLICRAFLYLFGTFLHEFSHFAAAFVLGRPEGFSIVPRVEGNVFVFGEVKARVRYRVLSVFIACAPLIWWMLLLIMARNALPVFQGADAQGLNIPMLLGKLRSFSSHDFFALWLVFQLLWAGRLSVQDLKTCIYGLISPSGLIFASLILLLQFLRRLR